MCLLMRIIFIGDHVKYFVCNKEKTPYSLFMRVKACGIIPKNQSVKNYWGCCEIGSFKRRAHTCPSQETVSQLWKESILPSFRNLETGAQLGKAAIFTSFRHVMPESSECFSTIKFLDYLVKPDNDEKKDAFT